MSYIEDNLMPDEKVLLRGSIHAAAFFIPVLLLLVILFALFYWLFTSNNPSWFIGLIFLVFLWQAIPPLAKAAVAFATTEFAVTSQRIIAKTGLIRRRTTEILLQKVESIKVDQGLLGRLFGYGRLEVVGTGEHPASSSESEIQSYLERISTRSSNITLGATIRPCLVDQAYRLPWKINPDGFFASTRLAIARLTCLE